MPLTIDAHGVPVAAQPRTLGTSTPKRRRRVYLAGPMTGLPGFNYDAFNKVAERWRRDGWEVLNPAEHFGGALGLDRAVYMRAGIEGVMKADAVAVLWGWEGSKGARLEVNVAMELGLPIYGEGSFPVLAESSLSIRERVALVPQEVLKQVIDGVALENLKVPEKSILLEAQNLVHGDRQRAYGHPRTNFQRIADLWSARLKEKLSEPITVEEVGMLMILIKVARDQQTPKRDNLTDIAGYAETISMCREEPKTPMTATMIHRASRA